MNSTEYIECDLIGNTLIKNDKKQENAISGIYKIINKIDGKYYIGSSVDIFTRWRKHREALKRNQHRNRYLQRAWNKYGINSFEFIIIEQVLQNKLEEVEQKHLNLAKNEKSKTYNLSFVSDRIEMTNEVKSILSQLAIARFSDIQNHPRYGMHTSEKTKEILRTKCSNKGSKNGMFDSKIYKFTNKTSETFIGTRYDFCKKHNIHSSRVSAIINKHGRSKRIHGWSIELYIK